MIEGKKLKFVDVHAHLEGERFKEDLFEVVKRFKDVGGKWIINSGVNPETNRQSLEMTKTFDCVKASFGIYPIDAIIAKFKDLNDDYPRKIEEFDYKQELAWIEKNFHNCVAIGEVGLDFKVIPEKHPQLEEIKKEQIMIFEEIIEFAKKLDKPLIVHSRGAEKEVMEILEKHKVQKVIIHCFGGKKGLIIRGSNLGYFFSIPPIIKRLQHFQTLVEIVPLKQLLTETDSPYLSPVAGERNEPRNVLYSIEEIARVKKMDEEEVAEQIYSNFKNMLGFS